MSISDEDTIEIERYLDESDNKNEEEHLKKLHEKITNIEVELDDAEMLDAFEAKEAEKDEAEEAEALEKYLSRDPVFTLDDDFPEKLRF